MIVLILDDAEGVNPQISHLQSPDDRDGVLKRLWEVLEIDSSF
jgi:hypothetical protein